MTAKSTVSVLKDFFEANGGRAITMPEMKALTAEERRQLADLAAPQLGLKFSEQEKGYVEV